MDNDKVLRNLRTIKLIRTIKKREYYRKLKIQHVQNKV